MGDEDVVGGDDGGDGGGGGGVQVTTVEGWIGTEMRPGLVVPRKFTPSCAQTHAFG